ncbi:hypothetical protein [Yersinia enterocolitica]|nr:hypothetical protein [Yersinia enterocolitica]
MAQANQVPQTVLSLLR